ncbi:VWA domain-containing protein [Intrasporangium sp. YIM S08009]|uniref:VWA domain-containing protein n=1 Tax=Intrasporangium zincisolvens TaxID=3080018 RepID=UPI002B05715B|nr:VWA domain-containing protein [Intrasporangium sp. YIM S08009]
MSFGQPLLLLLLLAVPVLLGAYAWQLRRRRRQAVRFPDVALLRAAGATRRTWRRHVPVALLLGALAVLGVGSARPTVEADVSASSSTIILALDVSGSMCATDVTPNRLSAAQAAVRDFVQHQDDATKIGLVVFSGFAQLAVAPTDDRDALLEAIDGVTTGRGTTIGAAILRSVDAIAELDPNVPPSDPVDEPSTDGAGTPAPASPTPTPSSPGDGPDGSGGPTRVPPAPEIVVLLTDGANTRGVTPAEAAEQAAERGVRVYPIGFGTRNPTRLACTLDQYGGLPGPGFGRDVSGGGFGSRAPDLGGRNFLVVDEAALRGVARTTGGEYFAAQDTEGLTKVLANLPKHVTVTHRVVDLSAAFVGLAALLLVGAVWVSVRQGFGGARRPSRG